MITTTETPSGVSIAFEDGTPDPDTGKAKRRGYKVDGQTLPSVTTVLGVVDKSGPLMGWVERVTLAGLEDLWARPDGITANNGLRDLLNQNGLRYTQLRDSAATRGQSVHDALQALATDGTPPALSAFPDEDRGYVRALCKWWLEYSPVAKHVEIPLASVYHGFAGKPDLVCDIQGVSHLVDLKTSKSIYETHHLQVAAYRLALEECGYEPATLGAILRVGEDGEFEFVPARADEDDFLAVRALYEVLKKVRRKPKAADRVTA